MYIPLTVQPGKVYCLVPARYAYIHTVLSPKIRFAFCQFALVFLRVRIEASFPFWAIESWHTAIQFQLSQQYPRSKNEKCFLSGETNEDETEGSLATQGRNCLAFYPVPGSLANCRFLFFYSLVVGKLFIFFC